MAGNTFALYGCAILLMRHLNIVCAEDDRYLVCSHAQDGGYPSSGWCRPVKRQLETELEEQLEEQVEQLRARYRRWTHVTSLDGEPNITSCHEAGVLPKLKPEIAQYMETAIEPFLELYHGSMRDAHVQMSHTMHRRVQREMAAALADRDKLSGESKLLIAELQVPEYCSEEKRATRRIPQQLVAAIARCAERARRALGKMKAYLEEMIALSKKHLSLVNNLKLHLEKWLSMISVQLGYDLEASTTRAQSHQDMAAERLDACVRDARDALRADNDLLRKQLHYCVET